MKFIQAIAFVATTIAAQDIEDILEEAAYIQDVFEDNPTEFLNNVQDSIIEELNNGVDQVDYELRNFQDNFDRWWNQVTREPKRDQGDDQRLCAYYFFPEREGTYFYVDTEHYGYSAGGTECAVWEDASGEQDWSAYNAQFGYNLLQNMKGLNLQKMPVATMQQALRAGAKNLSSLPQKTQSQVLMARDQNLLNLEQLVERLHRPTLLEATAATCSDSNFGTSNADYYECSYYDRNPGYCGWGDDGDFKSKEMCCACGGGVTQEAQDAVMDAFSTGLEDMLIDHERATEEPHASGPLPMRDVQELVAGLNWIGQDPNGFLDSMRQDIISELSRGVEDVNRGLNDIKRDILSRIPEDAATVNVEISTDDADTPVNNRIDENGFECQYWFNVGRENNYETGVDGLVDYYGTEPKEGSECAIWKNADGYADWDRYYAEMPSAQPGFAGLNLEHTAEYAEIQAMLDRYANAGTLNLEASYEPLAAPQWSINIDEQEAQSIAENIISETNEWNAEFEHIMSDWATDQELLERYYWNYELQPHLEAGQKLDEKTLSTVITFIADSTTVTGRPLVEVFPEIEAFMLDNFDPRGPTLGEKFGLYQLNLSENFSLVLAANYTAEVENELHHAVDEVSREPVTYEFYFDTDRVNYWIEKEVGNYDLIQRMYESEIESYWNQIREFTEQHHHNMRDLDRMTEEQIQDTAGDVVSYFEQNFSTSYATTLSAKIAGQKKETSYTEVMMYIICAILTLAAIAIQATAAITRKVRVPVLNNDVFERLV